MADLGQAGGGMAGEFDGFEETPRRRRWLWWLLLVLLIFLGGAAAMLWALLRWTPFDSFVHTRFGVATPAVTASAATAEPLPLIAPQPAPVRVDALSGQVADLSRRLDAIDRRARAASGNADRAEGLLVAFAARRALDRGAGLGYIEALLRDRFGATQKPAVAAVISTARLPVTLSWLQAELDRIAPSLKGGGAGTDWWTAFKSELGNLIVVRRAGQPPVDPADRLDRARRALASGQVEVALAEVARIPGNAGAAAWIAGARRYIASRAALDRIETAALLESHQVEHGAPTADTVDAQPRAAPVDVPPEQAADVPKI